MKIIQLSIIALSSCLMFQSCLKENAKPETTGPDPLWPEAVYLWPGEDSLITINTLPKILSVSSSDEKIVKAIVQDNKVKLSARASGTTAINVTGEANRVETREVSTMHLTYVWRNVVNEEPYKTSIVVEANDQTLAQNLKEQLLLESNEQYAFDFGQIPTDNKPGSFRFITVGKSAAVTTGTFNLHDLILELNFPASLVKYRVIPVKNREVLGLEQDLTDYYKAINPDKGIQKIVITQYIRRYLPPG